MDHKTDLDYSKKKLCFFLFVLKKRKGIQQLGLKLSGAKSYSIVRNILSEEAVGGESCLNLLELPTNSSVRHTLNKAMEDNVL